MRCGPRISKNFWCWCGAVLRFENFFGAARCGAAHRTEPPGASTNWFWCVDPCSKLHLIELNSKPFIHLENVFLFVTVIHENYNHVTYFSEPLYGYSDPDFWIENPKSRNIQ